MTFLTVDLDAVWLTLHDLFCPENFLRPSTKFKDVELLGGQIRNEYTDNVLKLIEALDAEH